MAFLPLFTAADVKAHLQRCRNTCPGPDGVRFSQLLAGGELLHTAIAELTNSWLAGEGWPDHENMSLFAPLPKVHDRPIALSNTFGKCMVGMLVGQLYLVAPNLVS